MYREENRSDYLPGRIQFDASNNNKLFNDKIKNDGKNCFSQTNKQKKNKQEHNITV